MVWSCDSDSIFRRSGRTVSNRATDQPHGGVDERRPLRAHNTARSKGYLVRLQFKDHRFICYS